MDITNFQDDDATTQRDKNISNSFIPPLNTMLNELQNFREHLQIYLEEAIRLGTEYFREKDLVVDIYLLNDLIRYHTRRLMKIKAGLDLFEDWGIDDTLANNGLAAKYEGYHVRVFKERGDGLLIPNSGTKTAFFCQQLELEMGIQIPVEFINKRPNVFFLWRLDGNLSLLPLRFVCPRYGEKYRNVTQVYYDEILSSIIRADIDITKDTNTDLSGLNITKKEDEKTNKSPDSEESEEDKNQDDIR